MPSSPERLELTAWTCAPCEPGGVPGADAWIDARVPGTAAGALRAAGREAGDLDEEDWWFACALRAEAPAAGERLLLHLDGLATRAVVRLDGEVVLESASMFRAHVVDVTAALGDGEEHALELRCHALGPLVREPRRPRARWRTRLVAQGLRFHRTMLLGRTPGMAPAPACVGPWRPVWLERRSPGAVSDMRLRTRVQGNDGVLRVQARVEGGAPAQAQVRVGEHVASLHADGELLRGELTVPDPAMWWPHTHGTPALHTVELELEPGAQPLRVGRVGFRTLDAGPSLAHDPVRDGLALHVNGVAVFARGAVWTPPDLVGMAPDEAEVRATLRRLVDGGCNLVRVVGTTAYESAAFHDACDELGLLVWQDAMFANLDYPVADDDFRAEVEHELAALVEAVSGRPSTAVLCGGSEVAQQVAMLGLDAGALLAGGIGDALLPAAVAAGESDAVVLPDAPCGGARPFRSDVGVANWFGVGGYRQDLGATRRAAVRFASECLALSNVPDAAADRATGVTRDAGAEWDFADVRDHYLALLHGLDPAALADEDLATYLERSRLVSGEVMAEVLGEWRRPASPCAGAVVLWLRDVAPGSGWGLLASDGTPKAAWHHLRRALAPVAVWSTDEGLNGLAVHVANDGATPLDATLRVALHRDGEHLVAEAQRPLALGAHESVTLDAEAVLGTFVDIAYAYRFGAAQQDVVTLELLDGDTSLSRSVRFPLGPPTVREEAEALGVRAVAGVGPDGATELTVTTRRVLYGVRVCVPGSEPDDDAFTLEPGGHATVLLRDAGTSEGPREGWITAANLLGRVRIEGFARPSSRPGAPGPPS